MEKLFWTEQRKPNNECSYDHCISETRFGRFLLTWKGWKEHKGYAFDETPWGEFWCDGWDSIEEAKKAAEDKFLEIVELFKTKKSNIDCCALDCCYNSRIVDKHCSGKCETDPNINVNGKCLDYDVFDLEDYKQVMGGRTPPDLKKRLVEGREGSFDDWTDSQNRWFEEAEKKYNL